MTHEDRIGQESGVDRRVRQFLDLVEESSTSLLSNGFVGTGAEAPGAAGQRPYSVRVTFARGDLGIITRLVLDFAGEENITSTALRGNEVVFESSATAHKGQEIRKALAHHFEQSLAELELE